MSAEPFVASHHPLSPEEEDRISSLLRLHLARDEISSRQGAGSSRYQYLPTNKAVELANYIFGYDGWSSSIQDVTIDFLEESKEGRWNVGVSCIMRITVRTGSYHEDVGYGQTVNMPGKAEALEKAKKEACSDGLKRALRLFGNKLGNSLSDQQYMQLLKSGKGQKEPLDLSTSPKKRMKLEPALTASTHTQQHNNHSGTLPPQSPSMEGYPVSPQHSYQAPSTATSTMPVSPNAAAPLNMSPGAQSAAALTAYNRQPGPSPPAIAASGASYPYKPRTASPAPPRSEGKENVVAAGSVQMDTSNNNAPLPSIHGIIHSLPASAHAAAQPFPNTPYTAAATVKQEVPTATAPYGPPTSTSRAFTSSHAPPNTASRPYGQPLPPTTTAVDVATLSPSAAITSNTALSYAGTTGSSVPYVSTAAGTAATFPLADTGGGFIAAYNGSSASAPAAAAGASFFGTDDDDSSGFISQWLTHNGTAGGGGQNSAAAATSTT